MIRSRLQEKYLEEVVPLLQKSFKYKSVMQVPRLKKICINQGLGAGVSNPKLIQVGIDELTAIAGQKAVATRAKNAISNFKLRAGTSVGVRVTLRGKRMYEFLDRLISIALPRTRNFWGLKATGFDGRGSYTMGITEQTVFPEIGIDKVLKMNGMGVTFVTSAQSKEATFQLLKALGMPFNMKEA